ETDAAASEDHYMMFSSRHLATGILLRLRYRDRTRAALSAVSRTTRDAVHSCHFWRRLIASRWPRVFKSFLACSPKLFPQAMTTSMTSTLHELHSTYRALVRTENEETLTTGVSSSSSSSS